MSSIDNSGGVAGGFNLSVSGVRGAVQLNDGNENLGSYPTIKTTAGTLSASLFIGDGGLLSNTAGVSNLQQVTAQGATTTDAITTGGLTTTGTISATSLLVDTLTESLTVVGDVNVGGNATVTGTLTTGTLIQTPVLEVSEDASITGNLTVSGDVVTISTNVTVTSNLIITNDGTGPALIANQTGNQPIVDFQDDSTSVLFISGGEGGRPAGYVGIGTTEPAKKLEVIGDIKGTNLTATGTLSSAGITSSDNLTITGADKSITVSNISTSKLTVSNRLSGGTISVSNVEATANLVVGGPADITGTLSAGGSLTGPSLTVSGRVQGATVSSTGQVVATGSLTGASATVSGRVQGATISSTGDVQGLNLTSTGTLSAAGITSSADINLPESGTGASITILPRTGNNADNAIEIYQAGAPAVLKSRIQYNGDADFRTITVSNIQGGSPLTIGAGADTINVQSNMIMVGGSVLTATTIQCATLTTEPNVNSNIEVSNIVASNLVQGSIVSATGSLTGASATVSGAIDGSSLVVTGLTSVASITSTNNVDIDGTISASNVESSNLTVSNRLSGGTISVSNVEATANLVVGGPADITGTLSTGGTITTSSNLVVGNSNLHVDNVAGYVGIGTDNPSYILHAREDVNTPAEIRVENPNTGVSARARFAMQHLSNVATIDLVKNNIFNIENNAETESLAQLRLIQNGDRPITFCTNGSGNERMRIAGGGNVGIGVTNPQQKLEVWGNMLLGQNNVDGFIHSGSNFALQADANVLIVADVNDQSGAASSDIIFGYGSPINVDADRDATFAELYPSGVPRVETMRIKSSTGNVGIGTNSPSYLLHVYAPDTSTAIVGATGTTQGTGVFYVGQSTSYGGGIAYNGDNSPNWDGSGQDYISLFRREDNSNYWTARNKYNSNDWEFRGSIYLDANNGLRTRTGGFGSVQTFGNNDYDGYSINGNAVFMSNGTSYGLYDDTNDDWGIRCIHDGGTELRYKNTVELVTTSYGIRCNGAASNGGCAVKGNANACLKLERAGISWTTDIGMLNSSGHLRVVNNSNGVQLNKNGTSWGAVSDERFKKNITILENNLDLISNIRCVSFNYKNEDDSAQKRIGFIAQDWLEVLPEIVDLNEADGEDNTEEQYLLRSGDTIPILCGAIKELLTKVESLEARIESLENSS